ncbi:flagellar basal body rod protein FlgB [Halonatronum saccharophilum]|uniref:flagellar basal body rod protein FlgB n=1 Tax=Halonatronum saccharophilum TaxID=150060 RepID=UPI00047F12D7|nr:flagellar basal body rod protein FlgB [Halonatronum saccharophilum]
MEIFNNNNFGVLQSALTSLSKNHRAISDNIANVDTPGYKRKSVSFKKELESLLEGSNNDLAVTNKRHISLGSRDISNFKPQISVEADSSAREDGNNVSIDAEMAFLAQNTLEYQAIARQVANQFNRLDSVIQKGGR